MTPINGLATYPDYGNTGTNQAQPDIDNTELATRLGSEFTFFRSGKVIYLDDCINLWAWSVTPFTTYANPVIYPSTPHGVAIHINPPHPDYVYLTRYIPIQEYNTIGLSALAIPYNLPGNACPITFTIAFYTGSFSPIIFLGRAVGAMVTALFS